MPDKPGRRWPRRLLVAVLALVALVAAGNVYVLATTRAQIVETVDAAPARPVVIVLGNAVMANGRPSRELAERLETACALYRAGRAPRIIASGLARPGYDEPKAMATWLVEQGVKREDIVLDGGGHRTAATMANAAGQGTRTALIATQPYHLPRAVYLARAAGIDAIGVTARSGGGSLYKRVRGILREYLARAETVVEVALRGVRA